MVAFRFAVLQIKVDSRPVSENEREDFRIKTKKQDKNVLEFKANLILGSSPRSNKQYVQRYSA